MFWDFSRVAREEVRYFGKKSSLMPYVLVILIFFSLGRNVYRDIYFAGRRFAGIVDFTAELQPPHRHEHNPHTTLV